MPPTQEMEKQHHPDEERKTAPQQRRIGTPQEATPTMGEGDSNNHPKEGEEDHQKMEAKQHNPKESEGNGEGIPTQRSKARTRTTLLELPLLHCHLVILNWSQAIRNSNFFKERQHLPKEADEDKTPSSSTGRGEQQQQKRREERQQHHPGDGEAGTMPLSCVSLRMLLEEFPVLCACVVRTWNLVHYFRSPCTGSH